MHRLALALAPLALLAAACDPAGPRPELDVTSQAHGCWTLQADEGALARAGDAYAFAGEGTPLRFQPTELGRVLLYDPEGGYVVAEGERLVRRTALRSDVTELQDGWVSAGEWQLETAAADWERHQLRNLRTGALIGPDGLVEEEQDASPLRFEPAEGCADHPEMQLAAEGAPARTTWDDGDLFGFVDMHSHIFTNLGFGGFLFHGSPFHPLGVEHALPDCSAVHGEEGRKDFFGYAYDESETGAGLTDRLPDMLAGELSIENHATAGWPGFTEWPNARKRSTHQVQYYRWLERAWLGGLRLVVQHATSNSVICDLSVGEGWAPARFDCEDMTAVDRQIDAAYALERYVDAQWGGAGRGWFRVVTSPAQAREVIAAGKMAVILGIETSDLFRCRITPRLRDPVCDAAHVEAQLDHYRERGVRVVFPVHKYDNAFAPGDGSGGFIEVGNFMNSGHWTNKVQEGCPDLPSTFDKGEVSFAGLLEPRDDYLAPPPEDLSDFPYAPLDTVLPYAAALLDGSIPGDHCQNGGLTPLGEQLVLGLMGRGMLLEIDHLPRRAYERTFELLVQHDYPALGTHGRTNRGRLFELGGLSQGGFARCHDPDRPGSALDGYRAQLDRMVAAGMHRSLGFGFDLNGFAHGPGPRFGPEGCGEDQTNPVVHPFTSYDGGVTFTEPWAGERLYDFNTEGMVHIGLLPEYVENARRGGATDADLEPLFRSAEGYVRMWEKAEARAAAMR